ncbi:MAG: lipoyl synthase [Candidatus Omnitrophica bacterium]|nr:lipoyl synthase [Candidatus Omnitrophota bacterium]
MPRLLERTPTEKRRLPDWFRKDIAPGHEAAKTDLLLKELGLHTICESGRCPNRDECYSQKTATFMIMGDICTRSCRFCSVSTGRPGSLEADEPQRVASAARTLGLEHVVVTSVNRDDLPDEGAGHFVRVIQELKKISKDIIIEILTPDFKRTQSRAVRLILEAGPDIFNHNVETVPRFYRDARPQGDYQRSLEIFREIRSRSQTVLTKSGLMLGLGETEEEVLQVLKDLKNAGCEMVTLGQYLQSSSLGLPVAEYVRPEVFANWKVTARSLGFSWVESAPFVRSSYHAKGSFEELKKCKKPID